MFKRLKNLFLPEINSDVQNFLDKKSLNVIWHSSNVILIFEAVALAVFLFTRKQFDSAAWVSIASVSYCLVSCLLGTVFSGIMRRKEALPHLAVEVFDCFYYLLLSGWGVQVSYRNYCSNEQILTFFAVQLMMVCFIPLRPMVSVLFSTAVYVTMYVLMYGVDGGAGINIFNYILLLLVTITGMIVRFHSEVRTSRQSVELTKTNDMLFFNNRHDGLTGLRNRKALEEDVHKIVNNRVIAYMIDINYFKEVNDTYGHAVGDAVLQKAAGWIKQVFGNARCYRYGGDEFLILSEDEEPYTEDTYLLSVSEITDEKLVVSIGRAEAVPKDHDELFELIARADEKLYEVKKRTHAPENGGHGERKRL